MTRFWALLFTSMITAGPVGAQEATPSPAQVAEVSPLQQVLQRVEAASEALSRLRAALGQDPQAAGEALSQAEAELRAALVALGRVEERHRIEELLQDLRAPAPAAVEPEAADSGGDGPSLLGAELASLSNEIAGATFNEAKLQSLRQRLADHTVSCEQATTLLALFSFSRDRVDALVFLYPRLVDPEGFAALVDQLKFASDRQAVRERLGLAAPSP